jgi:hypothetical protein
MQPLQAGDQTGVMLKLGVHTQNLSEEIEQIITHLLEGADELAGEVPESRVF